MSGYESRIEPARQYYNQLAPLTSFYYPPGNFSQPLLSSQQAFSHAPSYPPYFSNIPQLFSQFPLVLPPSAITRFPSAPMHTAASFQTHPGRFDVFASGVTRKIANGTLAARVRVAAAIKKKMLKRECMNAAACQNCRQANKLRGNVLNVIRLRRRETNKRRS